MRCAMTRNRISSPKWISANGIWSLTRDGQRLAVIEPSWDDHSWFLFGMDRSGEPAFAGAFRRLASLKAMLLLSARKAAFAEGAR